MFREPAPKVPSLSLQGSVTVTFFFRMLEEIESIFMKTLLTGSLSLHGE